MKNLDIDPENLHKYNIENYLLNLTVYLTNKYYA